MEKRLKRSTQQRMLAGVCGGVAEHLRVDVSLIRLLWVGLSLIEGAGVLLYIIAWIVIPERKD